MFFVPKKREINFCKSKGTCCVHKQNHNIYKHTSLAVAAASFTVETFINYLCICVVVVIGVVFAVAVVVVVVSYNIHLPWKNGAKYSYARIGPNPLYWPTNNSEKNIGNPIINTIKIYGIKNAPARDGVTRIYIYIFMCVCVALDTSRVACQIEEKKFKCIVIETAIYG